MARIPKTPMMLITGSLGSGKTTLLRRIIDSASSMPAAILQAGNLAAAPSGPAAILQAGNLAAAPSGPAAILQAGNLAAAPSGPAAISQAGNLAGGPTARIAVLMNEFGELAIDSRVISGKNIDIIELVRRVCLLLHDRGVRIRRKGNNRNNRA